MNIKQEWKNILLDNIWEYSEVGLAVVKKDGTFEYVNPYFCNMLDYTELELQGKTFQDITHNDDVDIDTKNAERLYNGEIKQYTMVKRYITKADEVLYVRLKALKVEMNNEFIFFLAHVEKYKSVKEAVVESIVQKKEFKKFIFKEFMKDYGGWIITALGGIGVIIKEIFVDK